MLKKIKKIYQLRITDQNKITKVNNLTQHKLFKMITH